jgi:hypothetical protein
MSGKNRACYIKKYPKSDAAASTPGAATFQLFAAITGTFGNR